jgi:integrase
MEIQSFSHWLMNKSTKTETIANKKNHNHKIAAVRSIERWFVEMYYQKSDPAQRAIETAQIIEAQAGIWKRMARKTNHKPEATDLTNDEISEIETYLRGQGIGENSTPIGARRYLMWRLAIEFGFRIGEILALRNEDCPSRTKTSFSIVRIEDRKNDADPRGINAPRPKTLGRDLGILFTNSVFPHLVSTFQSEHRHGWKISRKGIRIKDWVLPHPYLITDTEGNPLSVRGASKDAAAISEATGVEFTWHKARHAFFNRAYASIADIEDINVHNARIMDLVYWGGWNDPGSLSIYSRKARKDRAQSTFIFWQNGGTRWNELG